MIVIRLYERVGAFAENKDIARDIRREIIIPALEREEKVVLNFDRVDSTTQSFIHALLSDVIRRHGSDVLEQISFQSCNEIVRKIITIVVEYTQESI